MSEVTQNEPGLSSEERKKLATSRPLVKTVLIIALVGAIVVAFLAMLVISHEPHSMGLTPDVLRQRFKHPEPGAFELTPFYRNPDTGELDCFVHGIDDTTRISTKVRDSDKKNPLAYSSLGSPYRSVSAGAAKFRKTVFCYLWLVDASDRFVTLKRREKSIAIRSAIKRKQLRG